MFSTSFTEKNASLLKPGRRLQFISFYENYSYPAAVLILLSIYFSLAVVPFDPAFFFHTLTLAEALNSYQNVTLTVHHFQALLEHGNLVRYHADNR